jgi:hypothetical protein
MALYCNVAMKILDYRGVENEGKGTAVNSGGRWMDPGEDQREPQAIQASH